MLPNRSAVLGFIALLGLWFWAAIAPLSRHDWMLENLLVLATAALLLGTRRYFAFSPRSYWLLGVFLAMHIYGSHYTYSETPLGFWLSEQLGYERNHYDRLVHFAFGLLLLYPLREWLQRAAGLSGRWLTCLALTTVMALSGLYEQLEMLAAWVVAPDLGIAFLGTQGDEWDAQKDAGLAVLGALTATLLIHLHSYRSRCSSSANQPRRD